MMPKTELKQRLLQQCRDAVDVRLKTVERQIHDIQESLTSETKSSAGDKHETGRAMLQLEREKAGQQLAELEKTNLTLNKIDTSKTSEIVGLGSVVYTSGANYFIAVSAGILKFNDDTFFAISANTPIGLLLQGKQKEDQIVFRERSFKILKVV
ncbi:3-oxoacyl-ACP synthase [Sediminibacter sp. Hel_I_10]|uniref:3-oxoacyl-ACP synthase n=1 Tax=Sediminibacter sp. Hel_I_10 TaxID=1392490 RepID=UPI00350F0FE6